MGKKGVAIVRIPPLNRDVDRKKKAIANIISLSRNIFDRILIFEDTFKDHKVENIPVYKRRGYNVISNIILNFQYQFRLSVAIWQNRKKIDLAIWHGSTSLVLPLFISKLAGLKIAICVIGKPTEIHENKKKYLISIVYPSIIFFIEAISYLLSDKIIVFSNKMKEYSIIKKLDNKVYTLKFNFEKVSVKQSSITVRSNIITYVGSISHSKGADKLADAIELLYNRSNVKIDKVYFVGTGYLENELKEKLVHFPFELIEFTGWVTAEEVNKILSRSKIFVLPSLSEGLPKALIEAMANGTIPLVTPVGDIQDIVIDEETGFLLKDNSPNCIAEGIERVLNHPDLERVSENAKSFVSEELTYEVAIERYRKLIKSLGIANKRNESLR